MSMRCGLLSGVIIPRLKLDRKSTRLNSSHLVMSYAVFCLKQKERPHGLEDHGHRSARRLRSVPRLRAARARIWPLARPTRHSRLTNVDRPDAAVLDVRRL